MNLIQPCEEKWNYEGYLALPKYRGRLEETIETSILQQRVALAIADYRKAHKLNLARLSNQTSISRTHLTQILRGESNFSIGALYEICHALNMSFSDLIGERPDDRLSVTREWQFDDPTEQDT